MMSKDLVIVLPGISGSVLSKDGKEVWGASTAAIWRAVTSGGDSIQNLAIKGVDDPSLDDLGDGVTATGLVQDLHIIPGLWKIDGYTGLLARLKLSLQLEDGRNLFAFAYDWRRDNKVSARRLARAAKVWLDKWREISGASDAKLVWSLIRWAVSFRNIFSRSWAGGRTRALSSLSAHIDDVYSADDVVLRATPSIEAPIRAKVYDAQSSVLAQTVPLTPDGEAYVARIRLPPGSYRAKVTADFPANPVTVTEAFLTVN